MYFEAKNHIGFKIWKPISGGSPNFSMKPNDFWARNNVVSACLPAGASAGRNLLDIASSMYQVPGEILASHDVFGRLQKNKGNV